MPQTKQKIQQIKALRVLNDNILVEPYRPDIETESGIIAPTQYEDKAFSGKVIKIGNKVRDIRVGKTVYFNKYSTTSFIFDAKEYLILKIEDVIAFI